MATVEQMRADTERMLTTARDVQIQAQADGNHELAARYGAVVAEYLDNLNDLKTGAWAPSPGRR